MKVLIATNDYYPRIGGPYTVINLLLESLFNDKRIKKIKIIANNKDGNFKIKYNLKKIIKEFELIHYFGGWTPFHYEICKTSISLKKPYIITPMGIFEKWSLSQKNLKKKIAILLYQKKLLQNAKLIHCTSNEEKKSILDLNINAEIEVLHHGVKINKNLFERKNSKKKKIVFFSRLHKKKGIHELINAWLKINPKNCFLEIYGSDYEDILSKYFHIFSDDKYNIFYKGFSSDKEKVFTNSDLLILPTYEENFGMVIAEAISYGVPVITTKFTPWKDLEEYNAGFILNNINEDLIDILKRIDQLNDKELEAMSKNAKKLSENYDWDILYNQYFRMYQKCLAK